jgi:putative resolvase
MKLSVWAKKHGVCYKTAWRWWRTGTLPVSARQLATGTILVSEKEETHETGPEPVVLYTRVLSKDQSEDLDRQLARLVEYATSRGYPVKGAVKEVGSGLNGKRLKLLRLLRDPEARAIVVEHRDRLVRFGFEVMEALLDGAGRRIIVVEDGEMKEDLVQDMRDVLTSFCARLYGRRSAKRRATKALKEIEKGCREGEQIPPPRR